MTNHFPLGIPPRSIAGGTASRPSITPRSSVATPRDAGRFRLASPRKERLDPLGSSKGGRVQGVSAHDEALEMAIEAHMRGEDVNPAEFAGVVRARSARGHARLRVPELPVEYLEHRVRMRALLEAAEEEERTRRASVESLGGKDGNSASSSRLAKKARTRAEVVGMAGLLSSASDCAALLGGTLVSKDWAETVASMHSRDDMRTWLTAFGACVARLGGTLQDLHSQLNKQMRSEKKAKLQLQARNVLLQVEALEEAIDASEATTRTQSRQTAEHCVRALASSAHSMCEVPTRRTKLWTRTLVAGAAGVEREARHLREAQLGISEASEGTLGRCANAICFHACRLLGCEEACLYVGVHGTTREGLATGRETLFRLISPRPTQEELNESEDELHGTKACEVSAESLAGACLSQPQKLLRADRGKSDPRYNEFVDRIPGAPPPQALLYVDLSDPGGPLRAVLRLAHPFGSRHEAFSAVVERRALELAPLFQLALRHPCRVAAADLLTAHRARAMRSIGSCLEDASQLGAAGGLGAILASFATQAKAIASCEGCAIYTYEEGNQLVWLPPSAADVPVRVHIDNPAKAAGMDTPLPYGLLGLCASKRRVVAQSDCSVDDRFNPRFDRAPDLPSQTSSILCVPFEVVSTGAFCGVCVLVNKLDDPEHEGFLDEDQGMMITLLKVVGLAVDNWRSRAEIERMRGIMRRARETSELGGAA